MPTEETFALKALLPAGKFSIGYVSVVNSQINKTVDRHFISSQHACSRAKKATISKRKWRANKANRERENRRRNALKKAKKDRETYEETCTRLAEEKKKREERKARNAQKQSESALATVVPSSLMRPSVSRNECAGQYSVFTKIETLTVRTHFHEFAPFSAGESVEGALFSVDSGKDQTSMRLAHVAPSVSPQQ